MTGKDFNGKDDRMIDKKIKQNLQDLKAAISRADSQTMTDSLQELDRLASESPADIDPQLLHFLKRRSYDKALAFLSGDDDIPAGICGGSK